MSVFPWPIGPISIVKIREEADPFSMDLGTLGKGGIVKVLEVRRRGGSSEKGVPQAIRDGIVMSAYRAICKSTYVNGHAPSFVCSLTVLFFACFSYRRALVCWPCQRCTPGMGT